jgi:hypothetical protein
LLSHQRALPLGQGIGLLFELFEAILFGTVVEGCLGLSRSFLDGSLSPGLGLRQAAAVHLALAVGSFFAILRAPSGFPPLSADRFFLIGDPPVCLLRPPLGLFAQRLCALALTRGGTQACAIFH